jgi:hypothetical protein
LYEQNIIILGKWRALCLSEMKKGFNAFLSNDNYPRLCEDTGCWLVNQGLLLALVFSAKPLHVTNSKRGSEI